MTAPVHRTTERVCDVAIIGGSAAGLAAALQLARQQRSVIVVDAGEPRNAGADHMHSYLGFDGTPPSQLLAVGREEVRRYGVEVLAGRAQAVTGSLVDGFRVSLTGGHSLIARRVVAATGCVDELPDIEGIADRWGREVIHCPFCHGYEFRDRRIVLIATGPIALHQAILFRRLTAHLTLVLHGAVDGPELEALRTAGVAVIDDRARRICTGGDGRLKEVELASGERIAADAVAVTTKLRPRADPFVSIGLHPVVHPGGFGEMIPVDELGQTSVAGVFAAGNATDPSLQVLPAAAHGGRVGAMVAMSLASEEVASSTGPSGNESDWDHRYGGSQIWSGNPNGTLVREVSGIAPGRALDVGAGEGGDALWLAEQGWQVTASDISQRGLDRVTDEARSRGLQVACLRVDANAVEPFPAASFDLVSAHYASIPRTPDHRAVRNVLRAVAPGGTLLVVGHDPEPMRAPVDTHLHSRAFDADAFVRTEDFAAALANDPAWRIVAAETRPRPPGASSHHANDVVLRARRREELHHY